MAKKGVSCPWQNVASFFYLFYTGNCFRNQRNAPTDRLLLCCCPKRPIHPCSGASFLLLLFIMQPAIPHREKGTQEWATQTGRYTLGIISKYTCPEYVMYPLALACMLWRVCRRKRYTLFLPSPVSDFSRPLFVTQGPREKGVSTEQRGIRDSPKNHGGFQRKKCAWEPSRLISQKILHRTATTELVILYSFLLHAHA